MTGEHSAFQGDATVPIESGKVTDGIVDTDKLVRRVARLCPNRSDMVSNWQINSKRIHRREGVRRLRELRKGLTVLCRDHEKPHTGLRSSVVTSL